MIIYVDITFFTGSLKKPAIKSHIRMLIFFFVFKVVLLTADIGTDISTAVSFFKDGHLGWFTFTLIPIFTPTIVRISIDLSHLLNIYLTEEYPNFEVERRIILGNLKWHIPILQSIK